MKININQKAISLTDKYEIFIGNNLKFYGISEPLKTTAKISIFNAQNDNLVLKIAKKNFGIRANYLIEDSAEKQIYYLEEINNIKLILKCQIEEDLYQIYGHNDNKYSIFKNQKQVAFWQKNSLIFGEKDCYQIIANDSENYKILIAFCICLDNSKNNFQNELSFFNFDIGFKGNLLRKFDDKWEPNN